MSGWGNRDSRTPQRGRGQMADLLRRIDRLERVLSNTTLQGAGRIQLQGDRMDIQVHRLHWPSLRFWYNQTSGTAISVADGSVIVPNRGVYSVGSATAINFALTMGAIEYVYVNYNYNANAVSVQNLNSYPLSDPNDLKILYYTFTKNTDNEYERTYTHQVGDFVVATGIR